MPIVPLDVFQHSLCQPLGDDRAESELSRRVVFPGGVVAERDSLRWCGNFGHDQEALNDGTGQIVEGPEFRVPCELSLDQGRDPALGDDGTPLSVPGQGDEGGEVDER